MTTWFEGSSRVATEPQRIANDAQSYGAHCAAVLQFMPGITSAQLLEDDGTSIRIKTNEGTMQRTGIQREVAGGSMVLEFDEVYEVGTKFVASSHHRHEFIAAETGTAHRLTISDVHANGFLGWIYRHFAGRNIGRGILKSYAAYYEQAGTGPET